MKAQVMAPALHASFRLLRELAVQTMRFQPVIAPVRQSFAGLV
jgi:hypothetical protein